MTWIVHTYLQYIYVYKYIRILYKYKLDTGSKIHSERDQINKGNRVYCCYKVRLCCISHVAYYVSLCLRAWCIGKQGGVYEIYTTP